MGRDDTPGPQRALNERTPVRMPLAQFIALLIAMCGVAAACALWCDNVRRSLDDLGKRLARIEGALGIGATATTHTSYGAEGEAIP